MQPSIDVYCVPLCRNLTDKEFELLLSLVKELERHEALLPRFRKASERSLVGSLLVRMVLANRFRLNQSAISFHKNMYGKPFLMEPSHIFFNVSHSGDWVTCAFGPFPIGMDIEKIQTCKPEIAERFFTKAEREALLQKKGKERDLFFFGLWTIKEAYVKAIGKGLSIPLNSFSIQFCGEKMYIHDQSGSMTYSCIQVFIAEGYHSAVCFPAQPWNVIANVHYVSMEDIISCCLEGI